jgi:hypothetical protein
MAEVRLPAPVTAKRVSKDDFHANRDLPPGTFAWNGDPPQGIWSICPCGCGTRTMLPVHLNGGGRGWHWDGNLDAPTLSPSIFHYNGPNDPHWHGFLRGGYWTQV